MLLGLDPVHASPTASSAILESFSLNSSSVQIGIPSFNAFSYLLPGFSPTITTDVFLDTESTVFPPKDSIFSLASSLVNIVKLPVSTKLFPAKSSSSTISCPR